MRTAAWFGVGALFFIGAGLMFGGLLVIAADRWPMSDRRDGRTLGPRLVLIGGAVVGLGIAAVEFLRGVLPAP